MITRSIEDKLVIWNYKQLYVLGIEGLLENELEELSEIYKGLIEFSPVRWEPKYKRDFLAGFSLKPPVDITLSRAMDGKASIVTYSLNREKSGEIITDIVNNSGFEIYKPAEDFIKTIEMEIALFETKSYGICEAISRKLNEDLEKVVGAIRYSNFLHRYKGFSEAESIKASFEIFKLPKDKFIF